MKLAIVIPTYFRPDGNSITYLHRVLDCINNQTHTDYKVYLIGDNYENKTEFNNLANYINPTKLKLLNLDVAIERTRYEIGDHKLWCAGGVNANNVGIELALKDGIQYICHLDHDDFWVPNHLMNISNACEENKYVFIATLAHHSFYKTLPAGINANDNFLPQSCNLIHSSTCIKFSDIPLRYRDVFLELNAVSAADADLWDRIKSYMISYNLTGKIITELTCYHNKPL